MGTIPVSFQPPLWVIINCKNIAGHDKATDEKQIILLL